jgi:hypothetical protein
MGSGYQIQGKINCPIFLAKPTVPWEAFATCPGRSPDLWFIKTFRLPRYDTWWHLEVSPFTVAPPFRNFT